MSGKLTSQKKFVRSCVRFGLSSWLFALCFNEGNTDSLLWTHFGSVLLMTLSGRTIYRLTDYSCNMQTKKKTQKQIRMDKPEPKQPGPKADLLKIEGDWKEAIKKSLEKKKPADGWPK
jgi:hypothetical protein